MKKLFIKNRHQKKIAVIIDKPKNSKGLAFVMHGLGDNKNSDHIKKLAKCFYDNNYTVVRLDATNTFGESEGKFENANIINYYEDYKDVINWAKTQDFYSEPFILSGHSLGALASAWHAEHYPKKVKALLLIGSPINAKLSMQTYTKKELTDWKKTGYLIEDWGRAGKVKIKWSYMEAKKKFDLLKLAKKLTMPTLMITGEKDDASFPKNQKLLFTKIPGKKKFYIIPGAPHTLRTKKDLNNLYKTTNLWIKSLSI